jgi:serine/threonine-protein kinase HipA
LLRIGDRHVLVVDRFDRPPGGGRTGYASAMTMLEARDGDQRSYLEIAEVIEEKSDMASIELAQLWRRMAFTILISNTDDHLRNHGFLHRRGDVWNLSPAFDLNPNPEPGAKFLSTAIDEVETEASIGLLIDVADWFRLDRQASVEILAEVVRAVGQWRDVATVHGLADQEIDKMALAFEHAASIDAAKLAAGSRR